MDPLGTGTSTLTANGIRPHPLSQKKTAKNVIHPASPRDLHGKRSRYSG